MADERAAASQYIRGHGEPGQGREEPGYGGDLIYSRTLLPDLYRKRHLRLLWNQPRSIKQLFAAIESSFEEGLTPDEYHLQALQHLQHQLAAGPGDPALRAGFDLLLTDAFIRLAHDKGFAKVDPRRLYGDWNLPKRNVDDDLGTVVEEAIATAAVGEALAAFSPQHPTYRRLKQALARYRSIKVLGGWPRLGAGPLMKMGVQGERVLTLRRRLAATGDLSREEIDSPVFDEGLEGAVLRFQRRHYLDADGLVGRKTLAALNRSVEEKIDQIRVNLERARWILHGIPDTSILIDIAGFGLSFNRRGELPWSTRVVVGKPYHKTPIFASAIQYLVINPTWMIPRSIIVHETLPSIQEDPGYLREHNLRVLDPEGQIIAPSSIDWHSYSGKTFPYLIRQDPGPHNALGRIKFIFPNKYSVYLHDTPHRELFDKDQRAFSHGCIRVDRPLELAELILQNDGQSWDVNRLRELIAGGKGKTVRLKSPLPIMLLYWTVNVSGDHSVLFKQDLYGRDKVLLQALDGTFHLRETVFGELGNMEQ